MKKIPAVFLQKCIDIAGSFRYTIGRLMPADPKQRAYLLLGLRIASDFGVAIAAPVVVFVLAGRWLDQRYGGGNGFTIAAFIISALVSVRMIYRKAKAYGKEYEELNK